MANDLRGARGPNAERRRSTREKILTAAVRCLNENGYAQTSTVRVAEMAKVARGSLLHQFPTRTDLILAVAEHAMDVQRAAMRAGLAELPAGRERFVGSVDVTWRVFRTPESKALIEIIIATRHDADLAARIPDLAVEFEAAIARGAHRFAERSGLRDDRGEAATLRRLILLALRGMSVDTMLTGEDFDPAPVIALLRQLREDFFDSHVVEGGPEGTA